MVRSRKQLHQMRKHDLGDNVWFERDGEFHFGTISRLGGEWLSSSSGEYKSKIVAEILMPGDKVTVPVEEIMEESPVCTQHGRKLFSTERNEYICPFCET